MIRTDIEMSLKKKLPHRRFVHTKGVAATAVVLAKRYGVDCEQAELAGWLHDCARVYPTGTLIEECNRCNIAVTKIDEQSPVLLHAPLGAYLAREVYGIDDEAVLDAVLYHTVGRENMTRLEHIIYLADMIEPNREYDGVDVLRRLAERDLTQAMIAAFDQSIQHVIRTGGLIHPNTILARNELLLNG